MKRAVIVARTAPHQVTFGSAFAEGLRRHGWDAVISPSYHAADLVVLWGVRRSDFIQRQRVHGGEVVILERGYVGDRFKWTSVSFGGRLNGHASFRGPFTDASRWETHFAPLMKPWRDKPDGDVLIMGQVDGDMSLAGADIHHFYENARGSYEAAGYPVRFRQHPLSRLGRGNTGPLEQDLAAARAVVTFNSNSGVDAVLAGIPTVSIDSRSMAWAVTGHDLGLLPPTPDRTAWAHRLTWCQWSVDEMASGACWDAVGREVALA